MERQTIGEIIRKMESDYTRGNVTISEYVNFDMYATINKIEAYLNSVHIKGKTDSQNRMKPFFNIVKAASNIWYRATDIDRKHIRIKATKTKDVIDAFLATIHLQNWMIKSNFGIFLDEWGRVLARYGSAVVMFVEQGGELIPSVEPWNRLIVDPIDFDNNPRIRVLELTEAQLKKNKSYDQEVVKQLIDARRARTTLRGKAKDNKSDYIKLYEIHGDLEEYHLREKGSDERYMQQMHVVSFVSGKERGEWDEFTVYKGREAKDPFMITHLIKEDGRTLAIGAVENLFQSQWMMNHTAKAIKDQLDQASKIFYQTADGSFVGQNATSAIENGDILIHAVNMPLNRVNNETVNISAWESFGSMWKSLGNEINGISEAMLGIAPKSGTAWRQTEALLQESHSLFETMTKTKSVYLERMLREYILPFIKKKMDTSEEVAATLELDDIEWVDAKYIKNFSIKESNRIIADRVLKGKKVTPEDQMMLQQGLQNGMQEALKGLGNQRFFKPSEISTKTWKEQFKDLEDSLDIDIAGENKDYQGALATLNTALQVMLNPNYAQNKQAQMVVSEILNLTGTLSPLKLASVPSPMSSNQMGVMNGGSSFENLTAK